MLATTIDYRVYVVDGECLPVPGVEICARYHYPTAASTWDCAESDGDGVAFFSDEHVEPPSEVALFVNGELCGTYDVSDHVTLTLEM